MTGPGTDGDEPGLESHLSQELDAEVVDTEVLHDGLNLSLAVSTAEAERAFVLRRPNKLRHTEAFNDVRREYGILQRLRETPIPTPEPVLFCDDESVLGDPFMVATYLEGESVPLGAPLPERFRNPTDRRRFAEIVVDQLAALHAVDAERFADACKRFTPRDQVAQATERLDVATSVTGHEPPGLWDVADWLERHAPTEPEETLAHGDFRPSNLLFANRDHPEVSGVLDWETAFLGDPRTDLGYLLLRWRDDGDPTPSLQGIRARHPNSDAIQELAEDNERGLAPYTNDPGSPSRRELVARYEKRTGIAFEDDRFHRALAAFALATVWADLHRYGVAEGEPSDLEPRIEYVSLLATSIVEGVFAL